jgi:hypothetical protein
MEIDDDFTGIALFLDTENDNEIHVFNSSNGLESYLKEIENKIYKRKNILFFVNGEMNIGMSNIYVNRYLKPESKEYQAYQKHLQYLSKHNS